MISRQYIYDIAPLEDFDIRLIFECGQSFRFFPAERDGRQGYEGVAAGSFIRAEKARDGCIRVVSDAGKQFIDEYFDMSTDYSCVRSDILAHSMQNAALYDTMTRAMKAGTGIRILHQEPFETLISFITSQNNNIPRIRSLIARLCRELGNGFESPYGETVYAFPTAEAVASAGEKALLDMKFGFRAKYIARCAETVASGRFDLSSVSGLRDDEARMELMTLYGVGPKVANCVLLFGYARKDMFPVDVWIKRAINTRFGGTLPDFGAYAGIAQQYIFNNERNEI